MRRACVTSVGLCLTFFAGCAGGWPEIDEARWLSAIGAPKIERVRDLGTRPPPRPGERLAGESDGVAAPGELLLVEGAGFGRQPTVTIGGRAAEVVARTANGGLVARVPAAVEPGARAVEVEASGRRASASFPIRRLALLLHAESLRAVEVSAEGVRAVGAPLREPDARGIALASDGSCAYVARRGALDVIDLGAPGGPRPLDRRTLAPEAAEVRALVAAAAAPIVV